MQTCTGLLKNEKFRPKAELPILLVGVFPQTPLIEDFIFGGTRPRKLRIVCFRALAKTHSFRCSSSPQQVLRLAVGPLLALNLYGMTAH